MDGHTTREIGEPNELLILWPRIVPRDSVAPSVAKIAQSHAASLARVTVSDRPIDVRPAPERSCPRTGCEATTLGILLAGDDRGCIAVAMVTPPGVSETTLLPWGGQVLIKDIKIPFGQPPEAQIRIQSSAPCDTLVDTMTSRDEAIAKALHAAMPAPAPTP
jgi:hypothetical protein